MLTLGLEGAIYMLTSRSVPMPTFPLLSIDVSDMQIARQFREVCGTPKSSPKLTRVSPRRGEPVLDRGSRVN